MILTPLYQHIRQAREHLRQAVESTGHIRRTEQITLADRALADAERILRQVPNHHGLSRCESAP